MERENTFHVITSMMIVRGGISQLRKAIACLYSYYIGFIYNTYEMRFTTYYLPSIFISFCYSWVREDKNKTR